ncbi:hypothetical protein COV19_00810 [Candidatus Woesearchaeota archaeon CG10_big_fil_rev_8_21_14_0_10_44_13]|nr:MAG: hypothetical protein COV19_00810 [Candidatus Woesearchaeota archaeon CG10_big_fil_rev_8_21_14_0_10_44_13]
MELKGSLNRLFFGKISRKLVFLLLVFSLLLGCVGYVSLRIIEGIAAPINEDLPQGVRLISETSELDSLAQFIRYYDEVLTQSARNYAFTSDEKWRTRYYMSAPELDRMIKEAIEKGDEEDKSIFSSIDKANLALVDMEERAMSLTGEGRNSEAIGILESEEYWDQKEVYEAGLREYVSRRGAKYDEAFSASTGRIDAIIKTISQKISSNTRYFTLIFMAVLAFSIAAALLFSGSISKPILELTNASKELEKGNFKARVDIRTGDELGELGNTFNKTASTLERADEERSQLDKAKTEFLSITSHELRSPMTPMKAQLQMLLRGYYGKLNKKQKESTDIILRNTERLDGIILDFLEISRIEAARLKFNFVKTDLIGHINNVVKEMKAFMSEKRIKIELDLGKLPVIEADPDRTMQVLRNLLNNAIKFSNNNSKVIVHVEPKDKHILFSVKDSGIGMSHQERIRLFEPFYQAEQTIYRKYGGVGLGLSICRGIVESQGGKIWAESESGKGSTFYFTLPLVPVKEMKPIRVLFSDQEIIDVKLRNIFNEILGPMGEREFEELLEKGVTEGNILAYINSLVEKGILDKGSAESFKNKVKRVFAKPSSDINHHERGIEHEIEYFFRK